MPNFVLLATAWGPKYGGINAFNMDFAVGLARYLGNDGQVFCAVFRSTKEENENASAKGVHIVSIDRPADSAAYDKSWALDVWQRLQIEHPAKRIDWWVGHDVTTGWAAVEGPSLAGYGQSALIMHMNHADYQAYKGQVGQRAVEKERDQRRLFARAHRCFANGPLLRDALKEFTGDVSMLVPGFANVPIHPSSHRLHVVTYGRMDRENDRIKQGGLAVAGFASAVRQAWLNPGSPEKLKENPQIRVIGIREPGGEDERALKLLADTKADRKVNLIALPYDENRDELLEEIGRANVSLMLSWHEGFGLTGWEAVAGEVPLIVSRQTGLWQLLKETFGEQIASAYVRTIDVRGQDGGDDTTNFRPEDETDVRNAIIERVASLETARNTAVRLRQELTAALVCTWEHTAREFCEALGLRESNQPTKVEQISAHESASHTPSAPSSFVAIPKWSWPEEFAGKFEMPDSMLLRPEGRVVRFNRLREPLRDTIIQWAVERDQPIKLRLQAGEGGAGKTRLLIEVCDKLEKEHGWRAGFVDRSQSIATGLLALIKEGKPCLLVLDYAESRTAEIVELVRAAAYAKSAPPLRLVLLARDGGDWWNHLADSAGNDKAISAILQGFQTKAGPYRMEKEGIPKHNRAEFFDEALKDFATFRRQAAPVGDTPDLSDDIFADPLFIHLAAIARLRGEVGIGEKDLLGMTLRHERSYWRQLLGGAGLSEKIQPALEQAIALLTLYGGKRSAREAKATLARAPAVKQVETSDRAKVFDVLKQLYPLDGGLGGLQPDVLGETLVAEAFERDDELLDAAFDEKTSRDDVRSALTVLTRLGRRVPTEQRWLKRALERRLTALSEDALRVGMETGAPMPEILEEVVKAAKRHERHRTVDFLRPKLPKETINLVNLNVEFRRQTVSFLEDKKTGKGARRDIALAEALLSLSLALHGKGQHDEAARAAITAAHHADSALRSGKEQDRRLFAKVLDNLGNRLCDVGRFEEAIEAAEKANDLWRALAAKQPDSYMANWATSLNNLGGHLRDVGRFEETLELAEKAEGLWRDLASKQPDVYTDNWAGSLGNLGSLLRDIGRFDDALKVAEKAEGLRRGLAAKQPDAYTDSWARSLGNLSNAFSDIGRFEDALKAAEKTEGLWRDLAAKQPDAYTDSWARSLGNLGNRLREIGRFEDALKAAEKAEGLWCDLAAKQPDAYTDDWAGSLSNLDVCLSDFGRFEDALKAAERAEGLWRDLATKQANVYTAGWASSLGHLGGVLLYIGRFGDGLKAAEKAEGLFRDLAAKQPDAYTAGWAGTLGNLGVSLGDVGRLEDMLKAAEKAESLWRDLAEKQPDAYTADWAESLTNLSEAQFASGRYAAALDSAKMAISEISPFAGQYPAIYNPWVGYGHRVCSEAYFKLERIPEAAVEARVAVEIWIGVAATRQNYESVQVAKAFLVLMKCEKALDQKDNALLTFRRALDVLRVPLNVNPKPLKPTLSEMTDLARTIDPNAA